jgi:hypothetical protein
MNVAIPARTAATATLAHRSLTTHRGSLDSTPAVAEPRSVVGSGRVKTPKSNFRVERLSRLRRIEKNRSGGHRRKKKREKTILRILRA